MNEDYVIGLVKFALYTGGMTMAPLLLTGLVVGVSVGALQAATQVNEPTLTFVPKALAVGTVGAWLFPWGIDRMVVVFTAMVNGISQVAL